MKPDESPEAAAFAKIKPWVSHELAQLKHQHDRDYVEIQGAGGVRRAFAAKCVVPASGDTYFWFHESAQVKQNDVLVWRGTERWIVTGVTSVRDAQRCAVRTMLARDEELDPLLRKVGLKLSADYILQAKSRLAEGTQEALAESKSHCRNAIEAALQTITGSGGNAGVSKLRDFLDFKGSEVRFVDSLLTLLKDAMNALSTAGPHPPFPQPPSSVWAYEVTVATLRFIAASRNPRQAQTDH